MEEHKKYVQLKLLKNGMFYKLRPLSSFRWMQSKSPIKGLE